MKVMWPLALSPARTGLRERRITANGLAKAALGCWSCRDTAWRVVLHLGLWVAVAGMLGCGESDSATSTANRTRAVTQSFEMDKDIYVGVVWNSTQGNFFHGALLAAEDIEAEGGVQGRNLRLQFFDELPYVTSRSMQLSQSQGRYRNAVQLTGTALAREVISDKRIAAVLGHSTAEFTLPAMLVYQANNMLFFSAGNSGAQHALTSHPLHIQLKPKVDLMVDALTEALKRRNWKSVFVIYEATRQNEHALELLRSRFPEAGITMTGAGGFTGKVTQSDSKSRRVASVLHQLRDGNSSVIVMLTSPDFGGQLVRDLRTLGVLQQIVGFSSLDDDKYVGIAGDAGLGTLVTTSYQSDTYLAKRFEDAFRKRFPGVEADEEAAIGYDSVRLYADALSYSGRVNPQSVATTLNYKLPLWHGLLGSYRIEDGQVISLKYGLRKLQRDEEGKMRYVIVPKDPA